MHPYMLGKLLITPRKLRRSVETVGRGASPVTMKHKGISPARAGAASRRTSPPSLSWMGYRPDHDADGVGLVVGIGSLARPLETLIAEGIRHGSGYIAGRNTALNKRTARA